MENASLNPVRGAGDSRKPAKGSIAALGGGTSVGKFGISAATES